MFWWNLLISITVLLAVNYAARQYASARQERKETWRPAGPEEAANCEQLRRNFENREAIYIEQGALRVRVKNIQPNLRERYITAEVEEIPTPGLPGLLPRLPPDHTSPLRWEIGGGYLTTFSDDRWDTGYSGWSLFFAPRVVQAVVDLAAGWPDHLDAHGRHGRYTQVLRWLEDHDAYGQSRRVFPE